MAYKGIVFTDVDGVLCDGVYYLDNGQRARKFLAEDGHGFQLLKEAGFLCVMLSGEDDFNIRIRANKLGVRFFYAPDKLGLAKRIIRSNYIDYDINWDRIAFIGNDLPDLPLLRQVSYAACPDDAVRKVRDTVLLLDGGIVTAANGGHGAFREFADLLLRLFI